MFLTEMEKCDYIDNFCCPKCGVEIETSGDTSFDNGSVFISYICSCGAVITEGYELVTVEVEEE